MMTRRPTVEFDPSNKEHRSYYYDFLKTNSWKNCPVLWDFHKSYANVKGHIDFLLLDYYTNKEFNKDKRL